VQPAGASRWEAANQARFVLRAPEFEAILRAQGAGIAPCTPAELAAFNASETARLKKLIDSIGIQIE
jgi:tripartite-type tricarboxylate transporter receptor subunit TctC